MADSAPLKHGEFVEEGAISNYIGKELKDLVAYLPAVESAITKMATNINASLKGVNIAGFNLDELKKFNDLVKQTNDLTLLSAKAKKAEAAANIALEKQRQEEIKTTKAQVQADAQKQKSDEKKIQLTDKQIAQAQIDKQNKKDEIALLKASVIELDKTVGTLKRVEAANTRLRIERKNLNTDTAEGKKRLAELNAEIDKNNKYIIENSDKLKQQKLNVGNYTESIKKAFEGTGAIGEAINKYLGVITLLSEKIEGLVAVFVKETVAKEADAAATVENTVAEQANVVATEEAIAAEKVRTAGLEKEVVATEAATVANKGLGTSLLNLAKNPYVVAAAAVAVLSKVVYDNVTATQAQKDAFEQGEAAAAAYAKAILVAGVDAKELAISIAAITARQQKLEDKEIASIVNQQKLRTEAALAREEALKENKTIVERINLLEKFIELTRASAEDELEEARINAKIKADIVIASGKLVTREQIKSAEEAKAKVLEIEEAAANETRRAQKQITTLTEQYNDDTRKLLQDAQRQELELIDTHSKFKAEQLTRQLNKELSLNKLDTELKVEELKRQQATLGAIDKNGIDHTAEFKREVEILQRSGDAKAIELTQKTHEDILKLNEDFQQKQLDAEKKFQDDLRKLDESYIKLIGDIDKQQQDNELQRNQTEIDHQQNEISDLRDRRNQEIKEGKQTRSLTLVDLKNYFAVIDRLEAEHYELSKRKITDDADFSKYSEQNKTNDLIQEIKNRYAKIREEDAKAINNKNITPAARAKEVESNNAALAKKEAVEIEKVQRELSAQIILIDQKLKGSLSKADEDELKRQRDVLKQKQEITRQGIEDDKKAAAERKKVLDNVTDGIQEGLQKRAEIQQQADQVEIDRSNRVIEVQAKLAASGQDNILAEEQARATKAEEKKLQDQKDALKLQETITIVKTFADALNDALATNKPFLQALGEATAASGAVKAIFSSLFAGFYEGTEDTGTVNDPIDNKGGRLIIAHDNERILPKKLNDKLDGISNEDLVNNALAFENMYTPVFKSANVTTTAVKTQTHDYVLANVLSNKIDSLQRAIESKPVSNTELGRLGEWTEELQKGSMKQIIRHKNYGSRTSLRVKG